MPAPLDPRPSRWTRFKHRVDDLETWQKLTGSLMGLLAAFWLMSGWIDGAVSWYLARSALAGEIRALKKEVETLTQGQDRLNKRADNTSRLLLQKQEIDLTREIVFYEKGERAGRLSTGEQSYLDILRAQRTQVRRELRALPPVQP